MLDETKLWYRVGGYGLREFSTLAVRGQVTWADDDGVHDEDLSVSYTNLKLPTFVRLVPSDGCLP